MHMLIHLKIPLLGLDVFIEQTNVSNWFYKANLTDEKEYGNVSLTKKYATQIEVSFKSGENSVSICLLIKP